MALTATERVATRRFAGYPVGGAAPADALAVILDGLTGDEEAVLRTVYLAPLARLEVAIPNASDTLNTESAAVWKRNPVETAERAVLFRSIRMAMCRYLGIEPGLGVAEPAIIVPVPGETPIPTPGGGGGVIDPDDPLAKDQTIVPAILVVGMAWLAFLFVPMQYAGL